MKNVLWDIFVKSRAFLEEIIFCNIVLIWNKDLFLVVEMGLFCILLTKYITM